MPARTAGSALLRAAVLATLCVRCEASSRCFDEDTFWSSGEQQCTSCGDQYDIQPGYEFTSHCGHLDDGGRFDQPWRPCTTGTFNNGTLPHCQTCTHCPPGHTLRHKCTREKDTQCQEEVSTESTTPVTEGNSPVTEGTIHSTSTRQTQVSVSLNDTSAYLVALGCMAGVLALILLAVAMKCCTRKRHCLTKLFCRCKERAGSVLPTLSWRRAPSEQLDPQYIVIPDAGSPLLNQSGNSTPKLSSNGDQDPDSRHLDNVLTPKQQGAPLQAVLDNLDVLQELVILLDPESTVAKTTRNVAARCHFPATWVNYTYSMRDSKSPLQAVLEGVAAKWPDWTVGHLGRLLSDLGRNDAVAVLAKLPLVPRYIQH
ncbi:IGF-like family receptor 1 isoform X2 [Amia ocellicauda]|uniref:IGF-like family receptor 1 isoform X2 n=1 Tax=Amia ocellicauda TaxID=2972642 RepID=UPI003463A3B7